MKRTATAIVALVLVAAVAGVGWLLVRSDGPAPRASAPTATPTPTPTASPSASAARTSPRPAACPARVRPFEPTRIDVQGVRRSIGVVTPPRDAAGVPGTPPLTEAGKQVFAFDRGQGIRPGDRRGNVLLNAHTWPDGSALGNQLLGAVTKGDRIVLHGARGARLCYAVREVTQVLASQGFPAYYAKDGRPQLAIIVCSGRRLGPGEWESRTIFFASPAT